MIEEECRAIGLLLISKNKDYNNTALAPVPLLSKLDAEERLKVRIDDKLTRLIHLLDKETPNFESIEDNIGDLNGYLILWRVLRKLKHDSNTKEN